MTLRLNNVRVEARNPRRLAQFWIQALDWHLVFGTKDFVLIAPTTVRPIPPECLAVMFRRNEDATTGATSMVFDLAPTDQGREVERLLRLGASRSERDPGDPRWVLMNDPEGNEFCVLHTPGTLPAKGAARTGEAGPGG